MVRRERVADSWQIWGSRQDILQRRQEARRQVGERHLKRGERWVCRLRDLKAWDRRAVGLGREEKRMARKV